MKEEERSKVREYKMLPVFEVIGYTYLNPNEFV